MRKKGRSRPAVQQLLHDTPAMKQMREIAWGKESSQHLRKTVDKAIRLRDDEGLLKQAEQKRLRKAERNRKLHKDE